MICPSCGADLPETAAFCMGCGAHLTPKVSEAPTDPLCDALVESLGSSYEVMRLLGRGGMGAVYLARETALDRLVAVKVLPPEASDDQSRERFRREARTAAKLTHPNIVPLHSFGESDGMMYFVMGYVEGESLGDLLKRVGQLDEPQARAILSDIGAALGYAHQQGVLHRDVKPDNILLEGKTGKPMLTDFGIAKAAASGSTLTAIGSIVGSPYFMSPEQASGERDIDGRSDLYALGVVGYRMLSGRVPFDGDTLQEVIAKQVASEPVPLGTLLPDVSPQITDAVMRCLKKDPAGRWRDGAEFANALKVRSYWMDEQPTGLGIAHHETRAEIVMGVAALAVFLHSTADWSFGAVSWISLVILGWAGLGMLDDYTKGKRKGLSKASTLRAMFKPPGFWSFRLPKVLRPEDDVWDRLPEPITRYRDGLAISLLSILVGWAIAVPLTGHLGRVAEVVFGTGPILSGVVRLFGELMTLGPPIGSLFLLVPRGRRCLVWAKTENVSKQDLERMMIRRTFGTPFWERPEIERLLAPLVPGMPSKSSADESPGKLVSAISEMVGALKGPAAATCAEAASAARQILSAVEAVERELAVLTKDAQPEEIARIEARIEALGEVSEQDEVRQLLDRQLTIARQLQQRLDAASARRGRLLDLLHTLWLEVANLRAQSATESFDNREITGKIRAVCEDIERHVAATEETVKVITPSE